MPLERALSGTGTRTARFHGMAAAGRSFKGALRGARLVSLRRPPHIVGIVRTSSQARAAERVVRSRLNDEGQRMRDTALLRNLALLRDDALESHRGAAKAPAGGVLRPKAAPP
jgi:hypothetical protein